MFGELLYRLTPIDETLTPLQHVNIRRWKQSTGTPSIIFRWQVPDGFNFILKNAWIETQRAGAVTGDQVGLWTELELGAGNGCVITKQTRGSTQNFSSTASNDTWCRWIGEILIAEQTFIVCYSLYSGIDAGNITICSLSGLLIPMGNFALGGLQNV